MNHCLYRGHRRESFALQDIDELTELRAGQRTFDGAHVRTVLCSVGYALFILKVFRLILHAVSLSET